MYPELDQLDFSSLRERFEGPPIEGDEYAQSYFDEVAIRIRRVGGDEGLNYLLSLAGREDPTHLRAIFLALTMPPPVDRPDVRSLLSSHLGHGDSGVVASAIDGLTALGGPEDQADIPAMHEDDRPLVRSAVIRHQARIQGQMAIPKVIEALGDSDPTVRQSAIDALDELDAAEALPRVQELAADSDEHVRQAVETFIRNRSS